MGRIISKTGTIDRPFRALSFEPILEGLILGAGQNITIGKTALFTYANINRLILNANYRRLPQNNQVRIYLTPQAE